MFSFEEVSILHIDSFSPTQKKAATNKINQTEEPGGL